MLPEQLDAPEEIETPGVTTIEGLADLLGIDRSATSKAMPVVKPDDTLVLALVRGDDRLSETKLYDALPGASRPATDDEIRAAFGAGGGSLGPVGFSGEVIADQALREGQFVAGANRDGWHLRGRRGAAATTSRASPTCASRARATACPVCGGALIFRTAIEVGHIFNFGSFYSAPLGATFLDEDGQEKPLLGGSYGIGPGRVMAAIVEQHNDEHGIMWPPSVAPYDVHVVALAAGNPEVANIADRICDELEAGGLEVLLDDRDLRPGEKFADADLLGCPVRVTVGKKTLEDGRADVLVRAGREEDRVPVDEVAARVRELL